LHGDDTGNLEASEGIWSSFGNAHSTAIMATSQRRQSRPSTYLLLVYPIILALGSTWSVLSPSFDPQALGMNQDVKPNYFAGKGNLVNQYFVKLGWLWTTLAFTLLQLTTRPPAASKQKHYVQAAIRYAIVTSSWYLVTQWFFGPALIDRSFTITGGHCEAPAPNEPGFDIKSSITYPTISSAYTCKSSGGRWRGGHDISGHVFILVLSSAFLLYESFLADAHSQHPNVSPSVAAKLAHELTEEERKAVGGWESEAVAKLTVYARWFLYGVVALDLWMIMMTAIWFHTWLEKLSGLLIAGATLWGVYFL
jgi:hypothetical protein